MKLIQYTDYDKEIADKIIALEWFSYNNKIYINQK